MTRNTSLHKLANLYNFKRWINQVWWWFWEFCFEHEPQLFLFSEASTYSLISWRVIPHYTNLQICANLRDELIRLGACFGCFLSNTHPNCIFFGSLNIAIIRHITPLFPFRESRYLRSIWELPRFKIQIVLSWQSECPISRLPFNRRCGKA